MKKIPVNVFKPTEREKKWLELASEIFGVDSVSTIQVKDGNVILTYRETEEDDSSWCDCCISDFVLLTKSWIIHKDHIISSYTDIDGTGCAILLDKDKREVDRICGESEPQSIINMAKKFFGVPDA